VSPNREEGHSPARPSPGARSARRDRWAFDCIADRRPEKEIDHVCSVQNQETDSDRRARTKEHSGPARQGQGYLRPSKVLIGFEAWADLAAEVRRLYGPEEVVKGKRDEQFRAHRRRVVGPAKLFHRQRRCKELGNIRIIPRKCFETVPFEDQLAQVPFQMLYFRWFAFRRE
jgi:hypothetical protein